MLLVEEIQKQIPLLSVEDLLLLQTDIKGLIDKRKSMSSTLVEAYIRELMTDLASKFMEVNLLCDKSSLAMKKLEKQLDLIDFIMDKLLKEIITLVEDKDLQWSLGKEATLIIANIVNTLDEDDSELDHSDFFFNMTVLFWSDLAISSPVLNHMKKDIVHTIRNVFRDEDLTQHIDFGPRMEAQKPRKKQKV
jgi:hypothetical protein